MIWLRYYVRVRSGIWKLRMHDFEIAQIVHIDKSHLTLIRVHCAVWSKVPKEADPDVFRFSKSGRNFRRRRPTVQLTADFEAADAECRLCCKY